MWSVGFPRAVIGAVAAAALCLSMGAGTQADTATNGTQGTFESRVPSDGSGATPEPPTAPQTTNDIQLLMRPDGVVLAREEISFGDDPPEEFSRAFLLRERYDADDTYDRIYELSQIQATDADEKALEVDITQDRESATVRIDTAGVDSVVLTYQVHGAVSDLGDRVELEWIAVGGYSEQVASTSVLVDGGVPPQGLSCSAGDIRSSIYCTTADMGGHEQLFARFTQANLAGDQILRIVVSYPSGTATGKPILERGFSITSAFRITSFTASVFGLVLLVLVGGLILLIHVRGRDERATRAESRVGDHVPLADRDGTVRFSPPDDVRPGQIGTLIDEQVDVVDITATVVDLAVRGYCHIEELSPQVSHAHHASLDWRLRRTPTLPAGDTLQGYERELLHALFHGRDEVCVSELGEDFAERLVNVREKLYLEVVDLGWFARRPNAVRNHWTTAGIVLTIGGVVLTVLLAMLSTIAFIGLAVIIAGAAVTLGAQYMPAKTALGSRVFAHTIGFRRYLKRANADGIPPGASRVELFSRYLPYAIIFDKVESWASILAEELANEDLPWYEAPDNWGRDDFAGSIKTFTLTFSGVISSTRPFRTLI